LNGKERNKIRGKVTGAKFVDYGKRSTQPNSQRGNEEAWVSPDGEIIAILKWRR
jgi:hypothetical protein